jgi:hypothetical protein
LLATYPPVDGDERPGGLPAGECRNSRDVVLDVRLLQLGELPRPVDHERGLAAGEEAEVVVGRDGALEHSLATLAQLGDLPVSLDRPRLRDIEVLRVEVAVRLRAEHVAAAGGVERVDVIGVADGAHRPRHDLAHPAGRLQLLALAIISSIVFGASGASSVFRKSTMLFIVYGMP